MPSNCQKPEPEHCERRTKRKRNQQELDFERQDDDNLYVYTSLESTIPVQSTEVRDRIEIDSDMDKIIDDDPSPIINQQELDFERQNDNTHVYTSLESTMPVQSTEVRDNIGVDSDMDKIIDDDPSLIIEVGLTPLNSKCLILYVLIPF